MQNLDHKKLRQEFKVLLRSHAPEFAAESLSEKCVEIVQRERAKMLKSYSDQSSGEWKNINPHTEGPESVSDD